MHTPIARLVAAAFALLFIVAACASSTGAVWTYAPVAVTSEAPPESGAPAESGAPTESAAPPSGEGRVIDLVATASLQFTTPDGTQVTDIAVTPGETITFRVDNTAGFDHNFYIGTDAELAVPNATTPVGIPTWMSGVQQVTWVVPEDLTGLKFGCTIPGHYNTMQGTFSLGSGPAEAPSGDDPAAAGSPGADHEGMAAPAESAAPPSGEGRVIDLVATASLQFATPDGTRVTDIAVTPGETITFRVDNSAGFDHNFYIGTDAELSVPNATTPTGIPTWMSGVQEVTWVVPEDITGLKFGCTVPGHYSTMQGTFSVGAPAAEGPAATAAAPGESAAAPAESAAPPAGSAAPPAGEGRVIDLLATGSLQFTTPDGTRVTDIPVTPGETIIFRVDNTSGFEHNLYIGTDAELSVPSAVTDTGIPAWMSGVQELTWVVPEDITGLKFGCTIPGHYPAGMQGTFSLAA